MGDVELDETRAALAELVRENPLVQEVLAEELRALGYTVEPPVPPYVAIAAGESPPWSELSNQCPNGCSEEELPLQDSDPPMLQFISCPICKGQWIRGEIGPFPDA